MLLILTGNSTRKMKEQPFWRYTKKEAAKEKLALERRSNVLVLLINVQVCKYLEQNLDFNEPRYHERNWEARV